MIGWLPAPAGSAIETLGVNCAKSAVVFTPRSCSFSALNAWMLIGTSWMFSDRCWAVTTSSST